MAGSTPLFVGNVRIDNGAIVTPAGILPLVGSRWAITAVPTPRRKTPTWATVLVVAFALAATLLTPATHGASLVLLLGLLFVLVKETTVEGTAVVWVQAADGRQFAVQEHVTSAEQLNDLVQRVNHLQALGHPHQRA